MDLLGAAGFAEWQEQIALSVEIVGLWQ